MKISEGFSLRNIAGENIVVPIGTKNISFKGMITLNNIGAFLWKQYGCGCCHFGERYLDYMED
jgi:hypothetical protein